MATIRQRIMNALFRPEVAEMRRTQAATRELVHLIQAQPQLITRLAETGEYYDWILNQVRASDELNSYYWDAGNSLRRLSEVRSSRISVSTNPVSERQIETWTDFGFGQNIDIDVTDDPTPMTFAANAEIEAEVMDDTEGEVVKRKYDSASEWWEEFWTANRNLPTLCERVLHEHSNTVLIDGEVFFVFFTETLEKIGGENTRGLGGLVRVRTIPTDEITEILTDPEDRHVPLYYKRVYMPANAQQEASYAYVSPHLPDELGGVKTLYYRDWLADDMTLERAARNGFKLPQGARVADVSGTTEVRILHLAHRRKGLRGRPLLATSIDWSEEYSKFLTGRAAVAQYVQLWVDEFTTKTGSRGVDAVAGIFRSSLANSASTSSSGWVDTNPPPAPGSMLVHNDAMDVDRRPLTTGADDAEKDGDAILNMAGLSAGVPPMMLGRGELVRMSVADVMMAPVRRIWQRYQIFWKSAWKDMVKLVLEAGEKYAGKDFGDWRVDVYLDALVEASVQEIGFALQALGQLAGLPSTMISYRVLDIIALHLLRTIMQKLGIQDLDRVFGDVLERGLTAEELEGALSRDVYNDRLTPEDVDQVKQAVAATPSVSTQEAQALIRAALNLVSTQ